MYKKISTFVKTACKPSNMNPFFKAFWLLYLIFIYLPIGIIATILCAIITIVMCAVGDHKVWGYYPGKWWARFICLLTFCRVEVVGSENLKKGQSYVFAANHASIYDVFLIYGYIGVSFKWIMKKELQTVPFIGKACMSAGHIYVNRDGGKQALQSIQRAKEILSEGVSVVVFPEGFRTKNGEVGRFKRGAFEISKDMQLPIVPISLSGCYQVMKVGSSYPVPGKLKLRIHPPVDFKPQNHEEELQLIENIRNTIISRIES